MVNVTPKAPHVKQEGYGAIRDAEFRLFQNLMFTEAGVTLAASKKALVTSRLSKRLRARGCRSFRDYYELVEKEADERQWAVDLLTTNETYFFREPRHFEYLRTLVQADCSSRGAFRVWSAACSSGEEVYSIAMVLADRLAGSAWSVMGSDLNTQVLEKARKGHYALVRTDGIPNEYLRRFCLKGTGRQAGTFLVQRKLREHVQFRQINLNTPLPTIEPFDAIFLRNVMIYFSAETKAAVVRRVVSALKPGGHLFIGHSESLHGIAAGLELVRPSIYRKPL